MWNVTMGKTKKKIKFFDLKNYDGPLTAFTRGVTTVTNRQVRE